MVDFRQMTLFTKGKCKMGKHKELAELLLVEVRYTRGSLSTDYLMDLEILLIKI